MNLLYSFCNVSLTRQVLTYFQTKLRGAIDCITVIFFNDFWIVRVQLKSPVNGAELEDCCAVLKEYGIPYEPSSWLEKVFLKLDAGCDLTELMNEYHVVIISHGALQFEGIENFRRDFISGLGYCPPSLV